MDETVVLLHGLGRSHLSLFLLRRHLKRSGYTVVNIAYPSRAKPIEQLADFVTAQLPSATGKIHFVTHSLGGIILRYILRRQKPQNLGRVVMLCPPNQGSSLATRLRDWRLFKLFTGPAGQQIRTDASSIPNSLGPADFDLGIIIGNRSWDPLYIFVEGESDGKVAVEEAKLEGMRDFLVVPKGHTFLMNDKKVQAQIVNFLRRGNFKHT